MSFFGCFGNYKLLFSKLVVFLGVLEIIICCYQNEFFFLGVLEIIICFYQNEFFFVGVLEIIISCYQNELFFLGVMEMWREFCQGGDGAATRTVPDEVTGMRTLGIEAKEKL